MEPAQMCIRDRDQPLTALALNVHLKVNALEDDIIDYAHQLTLHGADHFNVLGADHHLYTCLLYTSRCV